MTKRATPEETLQGNGSGPCHLDCELPQSANCGSSLLRFIMRSDDHPATACSAAAAGSYATHVSQRAFDAGLTSLIDGLAAALPDKAVSSPASVNRKRSSTG
jgi:hypothetical protein